MVSIPSNDNNGKNVNSGKVEINGKTYQTVAYRLSEFRKQFPIGSKWNIETECIHRDEKAVVFKATIKTPDGQVVATGHAEEWRNSSYINRTSAYENAETSAIGRALANAGYIGAEFASAEELTHALEAQTSQAEAKPQPDKPEPQPQPSQTTEPAQPAELTPPEVNTPCPVAEPTSQAASPADPSEAQSQPKQDDPAKQAEPSKTTNEPTEEIAEKWVRANVEEWLDTPCPFAKAQGRSWRQLAENHGDKISLKGKACLPRAFLHALESWDACKVWPKAKARVVLEVVESPNGTHSH